jgi:putative addiction module component (TIGR02574 family)
MITCPGSVIADVIPLKEKQPFAEWNCQFPQSFEMLEYFWRIQMSIENTVSQISQLPIEQQLKIVHAIWDQMGNAAGIGATPQQQEELDRRMAKYRADPETGMTEDELRQKLKERRERT